MAAPEPGWMDASIKKLQAMREAAQAISAPIGSGQVPGGTAPSGKLDPRAVGVALAEFLKNQHDPVAQAISVRANSIQQTYPDRAY